MSVQGRAPSDCSSSCSLRIILVRMHHLIHPPAQSTANFEVIHNFEIRLGLSGSYLVKPGVSSRMEVSKPSEYVTLMLIRTWKPKTKVPRKKDSASCCCRGSKDSSEKNLLWLSECWTSWWSRAAGRWCVVKPAFASFLYAQPPNIAAALFLVSRRMHKSVLNPVPWRKWVSANA